MLLDLSKMRSARDRIERTFASADFEAEEEYTLAAPVRLAFDIFKDKDQFRLTGGVRSVLRLSCGRCLEHFERPVDMTFDLRFLPHAKNSGDGEIEVEDDDLTTAFYREDVIDLTQLVREQFYLALPMKPLCQDDCQGLCAICGMNLNTASCTCDRTWQDPRLAALQALLNRDTDKP